MMKCSVKEVTMVVLFSIFFTGACDYVFAGEWQKPWSSVEAAASQRCAKTFEAYQLQSICMENEKDGYNKMKTYKKEDIQGKGLKQNQPRQEDSIAFSESNSVDTIIGKLTVEKGKERINVKYGNRILWHETGVGASFKKITSFKHEDVLLYKFLTGGNAVGLSCENSLIIARKSGKFVRISYIGNCSADPAIEVKNNEIIMKYSQGPFRPPLLVLYQDGKVSGNGVALKFKREYGTNIVNKYADIPQYADKTHPYELLANNKIIQSEVRKLLKKDFLDFTDTLSVVSVGEIKGSYYIGQGNAPHQGTTEHGILCIDLYNGEVYAAMLREGRKIILYGVKNREYIPQPMEEWINFISMHYNGNIWQNLIFRN